MIGVVKAKTGIVAMPKVAWFWPSAICTPTGTFTKADELDRLTNCPPIPAFAVNVTMPCRDRPPITSDVDKVRAPTQAAGGGFTINEALAELADVAVMVAVVVEDTGDVFTENDALV